MVQNIFPLLILAPALNMPMLLFCPVHVLHVCNEGIIFPGLVPGPTGQPTWNKRVTLHCIQLLVRFVQEEYRINCTHQTGWVGGRLLVLPIVGPIFDIRSPSATHAGDHHPPYLACFVSAKVMSHCAPSLTGATKTFVFGSWS